MSETMTGLAQATRLDLSLSGMRVLVTAGAAGIGLAIVERLLAHEAKVFVCDVNDATLHSFGKANPQAGTVKADVSNDTDVDRMFAAVNSTLGGLDALINNAGIAGPTGAVEDIDPAEWRRCIDIDLTGQFLCARRAVPMLKAAGGGSIINMSSAAGKHGYAFRAPYSAAKFGVVGFTQSLAKELGPANIRVNAVCPGLLRTAMWTDVLNQYLSKAWGGNAESLFDNTVGTMCYLGREQTPADIGEAVVYLARADNVTGTSIVVAGGAEIH